jgi:hypothetical protein
VGEKDGEKVLFDEEERRKEGRATRKMFSKTQRKMRKARGFDREVVYIEVKEGENN